MILHLIIHHHKVTWWWPHGWINPRWSSLTTLLLWRVSLTMLDSYQERHPRIKRSTFSLSPRPLTMVSWEINPSTLTFISSVRRKKVLFFGLFFLLHTIGSHFFIFHTGSAHQITSLCPALGYRYALILPGMCDPSLQDPWGKQLPGMGFAACSFIFCSM